MNNCTSCETNAANNRESVNANQCDCKDGYYDDGTNEACKKCPAGCRVCALVDGAVECSLCCSKRSNGTDK